MTRAQFEEFMRDFRAKFPAVGDWLSDRPNAMDVLGEWYANAFVKLELAEALRASREIANGDHELGEWQAIPRIYKRIVRQYRWASRDRQEKERQAAGSRGAWAYVRTECGPAFSALVEERKRLRDAGYQGDELERRAHAFANALFADEDAEDGARDAVACPVCRDTGWVVCWSADAMQQARLHVTKDAPLHRAKLTSCAVSCLCTNGKATWKDPPSRGGREWTLPRYNAQQWVRLSGKEDADVLALVEWATDYVPDHLRAMFRDDQPAGPAQGSLDF